MSFLQSETQQGNFLLCPLARASGTQGDDSEGQVARQLLKQPNPRALDNVNTVEEYERAKTAFTDT